jgi:hypothetical protein
VLIIDDLKVMLAYLRDHELEELFTNADDEESPDKDDEDQMGEGVGSDFFYGGRMYLKSISIHVFTGK